MSRMDASAKWWPRLSAVEARDFEAERRSTEYDRLARNILIGASLYASFAVADLTTVTDIVPFALILRLGVVTPLILLNYPLRAVTHRRGHPTITELLIASTALVVQISIAVLLLATDSPHAQGYFSGFFPVMIYFALTLRVRLPLAVATMVAMGVTAVVGVQGATVLRPEVAAETSTVITATVILLLVMLVSREVDLRRSFQLRAQLRRALEEREGGLVALRAANLELEQLTELDELTRLPNRRALQARLDAWNAHGMVGVIAMIDVDHFKVFNDVHGHATGDDCLRLVATAMAGRLRDDGGFVARYGGEEFTLVLPTADAVGGAAVAERMRAAVEACDLGGLRVTISIGWACSVPGTFVLGEELLQRADEAVMEAKAAGRNRALPWTPHRHAHPATSGSSVPA